jgi:hypothetical protein
MKAGDTMIAKFSGRDLRGRKYREGTPLIYRVETGRSGWEVNTAPKPAAPAASSGLHRKCRCCGRIAIHTTAPHLGCDDCV